MPQLSHLYLCAQTRNLPNAQTANHIRLFRDGDQVAQFNPGSIGMPMGKARLLECSVTLDYQELVDAKIQIGLSGTDSWNVRSAFLFACSNDPGWDQEMFLPLADGVANPPVDCILSQQLDRPPVGLPTTDRLDLRPLHYMPLSTDVFSHVDHVVVVAATGGTSWFHHRYPGAVERIGRLVGEKAVDGIIGALGQREATNSPRGDIELLLYVPGSETCALALKEPLNTVEAQELAEDNGVYLNSFDVPGMVRPMDIPSMELAACSDGRWAPSQVWCFGVGSTEGQNTGRLLGYWEPIGSVVTRNPNGLGGQGAPALGVNPWLVSTPLDQ
jgi:hypothetical protein